MLTFFSYFRHRMSFKYFLAILFLNIKMVLLYVKAQGIATNIAVFLCMCYIIAVYQNYHNICSCLYTFLKLLLLPHFYDKCWLFVSTCNIYFANCFGPTLFTVGWTEEDSNCGLVCWLIRSFDLLLFVSVTRPF